MLSGCGRIEVDFGLFALIKTLIEGFLSIGLKVKAISIFGFVSLFFVLASLN